MLGPLLAVITGFWQNHPHALQWAPCLILVGGVLWAYTFAPEDGWWRQYRLPDFETANSYLPSIGVVLVRGIAFIVGTILLTIGISSTFIHLQAYINILNINNL